MVSRGSRSFAAIIAVVSVFAILTGVSFAIAWSFIRPRTAFEEMKAAKPLGPATTRSANAKEAIAKSRWWSKELTEKETDYLASLIVETNSGNIIWIDDAGSNIIVESASYGSLKEWEYPLAVPIAGLRPRRMLIRIDGSKRSTTDEAVDQLLSAVEKAEFKEGAGR